MAKHTKYAVAFFIFMLSGVGAVSARANTNGHNADRRFNFSDCSDYPPVIGVFVDDIKKKQKEAAAFTNPEDMFYVTPTQDDYIRMAISKRARDKFFADKKLEAYRADKGCNKIDPALDDLAAIVARTMPRNIPAAGEYSVHNAAEEAIMKRQINDLPSNDKIFKVGLESAAWTIEKNDLGIPIDRYKRGMIYARFDSADDPYCRMVFVNVIQDYAGGGRYSATRGAFIRSDVAGCPAGK